MREITASELSKILKEHKRWYDTDEDGGEKADLREADLSGVEWSGWSEYDDDQPRHLGKLTLTHWTFAFNHLSF